KRAKVKQDEAYLKFRGKQLKRFNDLLASGSIEARLVDEQEDRYEAALEAKNASQEAVKAAVAEQKDAKAKVVQANADLEEAKAKIKVAESELEHAKVMLNFATIRAPFDGVITFRDDRLAKGAFVRAATSSSAGAPLLSLQHT